jgi:TfoX/Sxy family transcriptional regulator of competence genes
MRQASPVPGPTAFNGLSDMPTPRACDTPAMAYDEDLGDRVRELVKDQEGLTERRMFGGLAFLIHGNMAVSASSRGGLLLRVDPAQTEALVHEPGAHRFDMRGREMDGWLHLDPDVLSTDRELEQWVARGLAYARSLPAKP